MEFLLYCPHCGERVHREPLSIDMEETIYCSKCFGATKAAELLTDKGRTFLDHLVWLSEISGGKVA